MYPVSLRKICFPQALWGKIAWLQRGKNLNLPKKSAMLLLLGK
jgi:hypothetical protein